MKQKETPLRKLHWYLGCGVNGQATDIYIFFVYETNINAYEKALNN